MMKSSNSVQAQSTDKFMNQKNLNVHIPKRIEKAVVKQ